MGCPIANKPCAGKLICTKDDYNVKRCLVPSRQCTAERTDCMAESYFAPMDGLYYEASLKLGAKNFSASTIEDYGGFVMREYNMTFCGGISDELMSQIEAMPINYCRITRYKHRCFHKWLPASEGICETESIDNKMLRLHPYMRTVTDMNMFRRSVLYFAKEDDSFTWGEFILAMLAGAGGLAVIGGSIFAVVRTKGYQARTEEDANANENANLLNETN